MILPSCSFLLWSVFFFPIFLPDAMPEHSELIDGDTGLGVYWESKNSFIRNYARLYWRAGAVRVSCPVQLGGRASGMKPTSFKKSSKNGTGRSIGQAVACLVMAAAITIGGAGTTFLLASQPAGLTVEPAALQTEGRVTLPRFDHKSDRSEAKAESTQPEESASSQEQAAASTPAAPATKAENTAAPAEMQNILRLGVHDDFLAVDVHIAVGGAGGSLGCALRDTGQLSTLVVAHQALAGLGSDEVGRLLAAVSQVAVCVQSGEVASGGTLRLVSLTGDVGLLGSGDVQAVILQGQNVASSGRDIDLDISGRFQSI